MSRRVGLIVFELDGQRYAIPLDSVREVVRAVAITRLPGAPAIIEGAINVRGRLVPVLDLRARFELSPSPLHPDQHLILARAGGRLVALRVDRASRLLEIDTAEIEAATRITPSIRQIAGVVRTETGLVLIHDLETFLTAAEAEALAEALESADLSAVAGGSPRVSTAAGER